MVERMVARTLPPARNQKTFRSPREVLVAGFLAARKVDSDEGQASHVGDDDQDIDGVEIHLVLPDEQMRDIWGQIR